MAKEYEKLLPSGAVLKFNLAPFEDSQELLQAIISEMKDVPFDSSREIGAVIKDLSTFVISSKKVDAALKKCMERARYNELKVNLKTFEADEARVDFYPAMLAVLKENIEPFMSGLMQSLPQFIAMLASIQK